MKKYFSLFVGFLLTIVATLTGAAGNVIMAAAAADLPDAGKTTAGDGVETVNDVSNSGASSVTHSEQYGDEDFHVTDLDTKVMKIRPMSTPLEQITRGKGGRHINSLITKYYSVGTRPIYTTLKEATTAQASGDRTTIKVDDINLFTEDDTIRVVGVPGVYDDKGVRYEEGDLIPDLMLKVIGVDETTGDLTVFAVNGNQDSSKNSIWLPVIAKGTRLVRMGKACSEFDAQTGMFVNLPTAEEQYCQNFMLQVEQSTFEKLWKNEANWTFSDLEEEGVYDFKVSRELTSLFGVKNAIKHASKKQQITYFTKGIWWMAGKDITLGHWEGTGDTAKLVIDEGDLVDFSKDLFIGVASTKRKVLFAGSDMVAAISKIKSERFRAKETVAIWDLRFTSFKTDFGEVLLIHHELFDQAGMSDYGFALEDGYLEKRIFMAFEKSALDLKKAGIRNSEARVLQEVSCLVLKNARAHARVQLAPKPAEESLDDEDGDGGLGA